MTGLAEIPVSGAPPGFEIATETGVGSGWPTVPANMTVCGVSASEGAGFTLALIFISLGLLLAVAEVIGSVAVY